MTAVELFVGAKVAAIVFIFQYWNKQQQQHVMWVIIFFSTTPIRLQKTLFSTKKSETDR
jgi:amino acid permease